MCFVDSHVNNQMHQTHGNGKTFPLGQAQRDGKLPLIQAQMLTVCKASNQS